MPSIVGMGTSFDLPNFVGDLFDISPEDTPLLSAIGGLTGGRPAYDKRFEWEYYDLRTPEANRQRVEGALAPTAGARVRKNAHNVVEIHQEAVEISYTRQALGNQGGYQTTLRGVSPVADEMRWQLDQELKQIARDVELSFITNAFAEPADNSSPRKTRGILEAITTNVIDMHNTIPTREDVDALFQLCYENAGMQEGDTRTLLIGPAMKRLMTELYIRKPGQGFYQQSRTVGGVNLATFECEFGTVNLMTDRYVPLGTIIALSLEDLAPRILEVPNKGFLFWEPLAKVGASDRSQIYGEIGLEYGNERKHAKIVDGKTPFDTILPKFSSGSGFPADVIAGSGMPDPTTATY